LEQRIAEGRSALSCHWAADAPDDQPEESTLYSGLTGADRESGKAGY
jgi:hypothetical protein